MSVGFTTQYAMPGGSRSLLMWQGCSSFEGLSRATERNQPLRPCTCASQPSSWLWKPTPVRFAPRLTTLNCRTEYTGRDSIRTPPHTARTRSVYRFSKAGSSWSARAAM